MGDKSSIEWTDATWNPVVGCSVVSPGCTHCYAMKQAARIERMGGKGGAKYAGLTSPSKAGPVWTGTVRLNDDALLQPLRWQRPRRIFVNSMSDLFHEDVPDEWIDRVFAVMALAPRHTFQVLTKRAARMHDYLSEPGAARRIYEQACDLCLALDPGVVLIAPGVDERRAPPGPRVRLGTWPIPHIWLGVSAEDQARADERIPHLLATPATVRFVSAEPLLGPLRLDRIAAPRLDADDEAEGSKFDCLDAPSDRYTFWDEDPLGPGERCVDSGDGPYRETRLDWVIVGGESGPGARPMHPDWARSIRDQCSAASVPFFFKQWGEWEPRDEWSPDLRLPMVAIGSDGAAVPYDVAPQDVGGHRLARVGKRRAGRTLDGRTHDALPGGAA